MGAPEPLDAMVGCFDLPAATTNQSLSRLPCHDSQSRHNDAPEARYNRLPL